MRSLIPSESIFISPRSKRPVLNRFSSVVSPLEMRSSISTRSSRVAWLSRSNPRWATFVANRFISLIKPRFPVIESIVMNPASASSPRVTRPESISSSISTKAPVRPSASRADGPMIPASMRASVSISSQSRIELSRRPRPASCLMLTYPLSRRLSGSI